LGRAVRQLLLLLLLLLLRRVRSVLPGPVLGDALLEILQSEL